MRHSDEMPFARPTAPRTLHTLRITLAEASPPIWRLVRVRSDATLGQLHGVIQAAMGWMNCHLHAFRVGREQFSDPTFELEDAQDEFEVQLTRCLAKPGDRIVYEYDFGDGWEHEVEFVESAAATAASPRAECRGGARACPPDDVGGVGGYEHLLEVLNDPKHKEHRDLKDWIAEMREEYAEYDRRFEGPFDPELFSVESANVAIAALSKGKRWDPSK